MSIGKHVKNGSCFVWQFGKKPFIAVDHKRCRVWCPADNRWYASRVVHDVPMVRISAQSDRGGTGLPAARSAYDIDSVAEQKDTHTSTTLQQPLTTTTSAQALDMLNSLFQITSNMLNNLFPRTSANRPPPAPQATQMAECFAKSAAKGHLLVCTHRVSRVRPSGWHTS